MSRPPSAALLIASPRQADFKTVIVTPCTRSLMLTPSGATEDVVVRVVPWWRPERLRSSRAKGESARKARGIAAPLLYDFRCDSPWFETPSMCMQFVPGQQRDLSSAPPAEIERLGSVVAGSTAGLSTILSIGPGARPT